MSGRNFHFEWDDNKAHANIQKHGISFESAQTVFNDSRLLTVADFAHSEIEDRWFSIGCGSDGRLISVVYLWRETGRDSIVVRIISARKATTAEIRYYQESL